MSVVAEYLEQHSRATDAALEALVAGWTGGPEGLTKAIRYSLFAGGKRLRPVLCLGSAQAVGGDAAAALPAACAIEMIHTYSLVHDDLPCMDDDDIRRGKPSSHRAFDEATAVLAGDALNAMAFEAAAATGNIEVIREIAHAAGVAGMVGGQFIDLESEGKSLSLEAVQDMHRKKTGALIRVAVRTGAMLGTATADQLDALTAYGEHIGLAFQIADDVLDVVGDDDEMGKRSGMDRARRKSTYPALVGLDEARRLGQEAVDGAIAALAPLGEGAESLRELARYVMERKR